MQRVGRSQDICELEETPLRFLRGGYFFIMATTTLIVPKITTARRFINAIVSETVIAWSPPSVLMRENNRATLPMKVV